MEKFLNFIELKKSLFWRMLLVLTNFFETVGKVEVNIEHLNFKDTVLVIHYLDTVSQWNVNWNKENKNKRYNSKSKTNQKVLLIMLDMEKQRCKN